MAGRKKKLDQTVAAIQRQHGAKALQQGAKRSPTPEVSISTGFPQLDGITGCDGIPLGVMSLMTGQSTSGKLTVAYKLLVNAQKKVGRHSNTLAALVDMTHTANADYLARCGIDLNKLLLVRPATNEHAVHLILDLVRSHEVNMIVVDNLADLFNDRATRQTLANRLRRLPPMLRAATCGLVLIDEVNPPWLQESSRNDRNDLYRQISLHIKLQREQWIERNRRVTGYRAHADIVRSRWSSVGGKTMIEIIFNGTVKARKTW
jgi:hypothetical protein